MGEETIFGWCFEPCPLCGSHRVGFNWHLLNKMVAHFVECKKCGCRTGYKREKEDAKTSWQSTR